MEMLVRCFSLLTQKLKLYSKAGAKNLALLADVNSFWIKKPRRENEAFERLQLFRSNELSLAARFCSLAVAAEVVYTGKFEINVGGKCKNSRRNYE